jgi:hypothetical protein
MIESDHNVQVLYEIIVKKTQKIMEDGDYIVKTKQSNLLFRSIMSNIVFFLVFYVLFLLKIYI